MITGFSGHLISEQFLEQQIGRLSTTRLDAWLRDRISEVPREPASARAGVNGPHASRVCRRTHRPHVGISCVWPMWTFSKTLRRPRLRSDSVVVALVVTNWGERLDPWWRAAVVEAGRRGASWCLLFNGTHVRLVNAARVFSRRFVEFDLDCAADDDKTLSAMRTLISAEALARTTPTRRRLVSRRSRRFVGASRVGRVPIAAKRRARSLGARSASAWWPGLTRSL